VPAASGLRGARVRVTTWPSQFTNREAPAKIFRQAFTDDLAAAGVAVVDADQDLDLAFDFLGMEGTTFRARGTLSRAGGGEVQKLAVDDSVECYDSWDDLGNGNLTRCFARHLAIDLLESRQAAAAVRSARPQAATPQRRALAGKLAVLELRNFSKDLTHENAQYFTDVVRSAALTAQPQLQVITRENLLVLLQASGKDLANCEGECEVDTGRRIGADQIVSGELQKVGARYKLTLRLHDTREGRLLSSTQASGKTIEELDDAAQKAAADLLSGR
jgi:TolB-like protein